MRIDADAVAAYAEGCAILGTGGGGDIRVPVLIARAALSEHGDRKSTRLNSSHT